MTEENYRRWDIFVKAVAPLVTVVGIVVGVWQFSRDQSAQLERQYALIARNDRVEFKRKTWEKQREIYTRIGELVGKMAGSDSSKEEVRKDAEQFEGLYWGNSIYVEDPQVEQAMIDFHNEVGDLLRDISTKDRLKVRADMLIKALRESSKVDWLQETK